MALRPVAAFMSQDIGTVAAGVEKEDQRECADGRGAREKGREKEIRGDKKICKLRKIGFDAARELRADKTRRRSC